MLEHCELTVLSRCRCAALSDRHLGLTPAVCMQQHACVCPYTYLQHALHNLCNVCRQACTPAACMCACAGVHACDMHVSMQGSRHHAESLTIGCNPWKCSRPSPLTLECAPPLSLTGFRYLLRSPPGPAGALAAAASLARVGGNCFLLLVGETIHSSRSA